MKVVSVIDLGQQNEMDLADKQDYWEIKKTQQWPKIH